MPIEKPSAILVREDAGEAPLRVFEPPDIVDIDHEQVARLRPFDSEGTAQVVHLGKVDIANVVRGIVVLDLSTRPVVALYPELVARLELFHDWNVRVPAIVGLGRLILRPFVHFGSEYGLCHCSLLIWSACPSGAASR